MQKAKMIDMFGNDMSNTKDVEMFAQYQQMLNQPIVKTSKKPFKSGHKEGIPFAIIKHPIIDRLAFMMKDDDTYVSCNQCQLMNM